MNTSTFPKATLRFVNEKGVPVFTILKRVNCTILSEPPMVQITHYIDGIKEPSNKRTLIFPSSLFLSFEAEGYAS